MENLTDRQFQVLIKEYEMLQSRSKDCETRRFQIHGWSISIFSAAVGLTVLRNEPLFLMIPLLTCLLFWGMDSLYKSFQRILIDRSLEVESIFAGISTIVEVGVLSRRFESRDKTILGRIRRVGQRIFAFNVMVLYVGQIFTLLVIWLAMAQLNNGIS